MNNSSFKFFWGMILLIVGAIWLAFVMGWIEDIYVLSHCWPLFIIVPCLLRFFFAQDRFLSVMGIVIGCIWQLHYWAPSMIDLRMARMSMLPILLIGVALHMLLGNRLARPSKSSSKNKHH